MHGCWNFLAGGESWGGSLVLPRANQEAIPGPKLNVGNFLEFLGFLPDLSGIAPPKMEDCRPVPMENRISDRKG
jgi:hypothetical protein